MVLSIKLISSTFSDPTQEGQLSTEVLPTPFSPSGAITPTPHRPHSTQPFVMVITLSVAAMADE